MISFSKLVDQIQSIFCPKFLEKSQIHSKTKIIISIFFENFKYAIGKKFKDPAGRYGKENRSFCQTLPLLDFSSLIFHLNLETLKSLHILH